MENSALEAISFRLLNRQRWPVRRHEVQVVPHSKRNPAVFARAGTKPNTKVSGSARALSRLMTRVSGNLFHGLALAPALTCSDVVSGAGEIWRSTG